MSTPPPVDPATRREAVRSPLRLEILGLFTEGRALSVPEMAERMGRSAPSLYHHVRLLADAGLLERAGRGEGAPGGGPGPALWAPTPEAAPLDLEGDGDPAVLQEVMAAAFRMAERDLAAALETPGEARAGEGLHALRLHVRLSPSGRERIEGLLSELVDAVREGSRNARPPEPGEAHHSLTLAFLPLANRTC